MPRLWSGLVDHLEGKTLCQTMGNRRKPDLRSDFLLTRLFPVSLPIGLERVSALPVNVLGHPGNRDCRIDCILAPL